MSRRAGGGAEDEKLRIVLESLEKSRAISSTANAGRKAQGKKPAVISPLALEVVRRIDALFEI